MEVIPAIDLRGGRAVRLVQGDFSRETTFADDPVAVARRWQEEGATRLHVVDLDGARAREPLQLGVVRAIARAAGVPVQLGGGIRSEEAARQAVDAGVDRVVVGTAALEDPGLLATLVESLGQRLVVALDARGGRVVVRAWESDSGRPVGEVARELVARGAPRFLYTQVERDGMLEGPDFAGVHYLVHATGRPVIASGGVASIEHLRRLAELGVEGAVVGMALYRGAFRLTEALAALARPGSAASESDPAL